MNSDAREHILSQVADVLERLRLLSHDPHLMIGRSWNEKEELALLQAIGQAEQFANLIKSDLAK